MYYKDFDLINILSEVTCVYTIRTSFISLFMFRLQNFANFEILFDYIYIYNIFKISYLWPSLSKFQEYWMKFKVVKIDLIVYLILTCI